MSLNLREASVRCMDEHKLVGLPVDFACILEQAERDTVHWCVAPSFVEESACTVQMSKVIFIGLATPEIHVCNLEVAPEMACAVAMGFEVVLWAALAIDQPGHGVVLVKMFGMCGEEFDGFRPERGNRFWTIVEIDVEAVGLIVVLHVTEHVVIDVAEELDFGLYTPVVCGIF